MVVSWPEINVGGGARREEERRDGGGRGYGRTEGGTGDFLSAELCDSATSTSQSSINTTTNGTAGMGDMDHGASVLRPPMTHVIEYGFFYDPERKGLTVQAGDTVRCASVRLRRVPARQ